MSEPFIGYIDQKIITRALSDPTFRTALAKDPQQALTKAGFKVTAEQLSAIVLARPAEWGGLTMEDIARRIDLAWKKK